MVKKSRLKQSDKYEGSVIGQGFRLGTQTLHSRQDTTDTGTIHQEFGHDSGCHLKYGSPGIFPRWHFIIYAPFLSHSDIASHLQTRLLLTCSMVA